MSQAGVYHDLRGLMKRGRGSLLPAANSSHCVGGQRYKRLHMERGRSKSGQRTGRSLEHPSRSPPECLSVSRLAHVESMVLLCYTAIKAPIFILRTKATDNWSRRLAEVFQCNIELFFVFASVWSYLLCFHSVLFTLTTSGVVCSSEHFFSSGHGHLCRYRLQSDL